MGMEFAAERRLLSENEYEPIVRSHQPAVGSLSRDELVELARWLRDQRGRARDVVRHRHRVQRGKADSRGTAADIASSRGLTAKKQVFARALKRVNARLHALDAARKRATATANMRIALARRRAERLHHPSGSMTGNAGMRSLQSTRRRTRVPPGVIGSVSQAGKAAQAARDSRGRS